MFQFLLFITFDDFVGWIVGTGYWFVFGWLVTGWSGAATSLSWNAMSSPGLGRDSFRVSERGLSLELLGSLVG